MSHLTPTALALLITQLTPRLPLENCTPPRQWPARRTFGLQSLGDCLPRSKHLATIPQRVETSTAWSISRAIQGYMNPARRWFRARMRKRRSPAVLFGNWQSRRTPPCRTLNAHARPSRFLVRTHKPQSQCQRRQRFSHVVTHKAALRRLGKQELVIISSLLRQIFVSGPLKLPGTTMAKTRARRPQQHHTLHWGAALILV